MKYIRYIITGVLILLSVNIYSQFLSTMGGGGSESTPSTLYNNLIAAWGLNEASGTIYDYTANDYDGTATNTPTYEAGGKVNEAISYLRTSTEYIDFGTSFWDPGTSDVSVSAWFYVNSLNVHHGIVGNWGTYPYWYLRVSNINYIYGVVNFAGTNIDVDSDVFGTVSTGTWYHIIFTLDRSGNALLYVNNGVQGAESISAHSAVSLANDNTHAIGGIGDENATYAMDGRVDAVQVWSKILTSDERAELYNSGNGWEP